MEQIKGLKKNAIILFIVTIGILIIVLKDDFKGIVDTLKGMDIRFLFVGIILYFISIFIKGYINYKTVANKKKISIVEATKHQLITQFFNGITPFSTGGQPMEVYMLTQHGISVSEATNITIQNFVFYQIALVIFGLFAVGYNYLFHLFPKEIILRRLVFLGFMINTGVAIVLLLITLSKKATKKISKIIIFFLHKIRIIKNKEEVTKNIEQKLSEFHHSAAQIRKRKKLLIGGIILNFVSLALLYVVPLFIIYAMHDYHSITLSESLTASAYVLIIGSFVPIPGASGGIEYGFFKFYGNFLKQEIVKAVLIVWRFITYYLPMIGGAILLNFEKKGD